jgi:hypothetical protein
MASFTKLPETVAEFQTSFHDALNIRYLRHSQQLENCTQESNQSTSTITKIDLLQATLVEHTSTDRAPVERFISQCFERSYGCLLNAFMPRLFSVRSRKGRIIGAFGLRSGTSRLYLEQYLDTPIEKTIKSITQKTVDRKSIVEVGNFSGSIPGSMRAMIFLLAERLNREGFEWLAFTGTAALRNSFHQLGLASCLVDIREATAEKLSPAEQANWGSYYAHAPRVAFGHIRQGYASLIGQGIG